MFPKIVTETKIFFFLTFLSFRAVWSLVCAKPAYKDLSQKPKDSNPDEYNIFGGFTCKLGKKIIQGEKHNK